METSNKLKVIERPLPQTAYVISEQTASLARQEFLSLHLRGIQSPHNLVLSLSFPLTYTHLLL